MDFLNKSLRDLRFAAPVAALLILAAGCTSEYDPYSEGDNVMVINMLAEPGHPLTADVTHSWDSSQRPAGDVTVTDASVTVIIDGIPAGAMTFNPVSRHYESDYLPREGEQISISATSPTYGMASGETRVPNGVKIDHWSFNPVVETDYDGIVTNGDSLSYLRRLNIEYSITFTDPAEEDNYYMISGRPYYETGGGFSSDPIISENNTPLDAVFSANKTFVVFSDRSINGKTYTLRYTCSYTPFIPVTELGSRLTDRISLCAISRDYYLYLLSVYRKYGDLNHNLEDLGLSEPKIIYTNVMSGAGIIASQSTDTIVNDVHDIVCRFAGIDPALPDRVD